MKSELASSPVLDAEEKAIRSIHYRMIEAWNFGDAVAFLASFRDDADFVAFEGTHLKGREQMLTFHQRIFDTVVKGSRMEGEVKFVRFVGPTLAVMHSTVTYALRGQTRASRARDSIQLTVVTKRDGEWRAEALMNARRVTLEDQDFVDGIDLLPAQAQREVRDLVASLKERHPCLIRRLRTMRRRLVDPRNRPDAGRTTTARCGWLQELPRLTV